MCDSLASIYEQYICTYIYAFTVCAYACKGRLGFTPCRKVYVRAWALRTERAHYSEFHVARIIGSRLKFACACSKWIGAASLFLCDEVHEADKGICSCGASSEGFESARPLQSDPVSLRHFHPRTDLGYVFGGCKT